MASFLIVCGGTGGHLSPGIALAEALMARGYSCSLVVSKKEVDSRLLNKYQHLEYIRIGGTYFSWRPKQLLRFLVGTVQGLLQTLRLLPRVSPVCVFGFGGFLTVLVAMGARILGYPLVLHEANRRVGRATWWMGRFAHRLYLPPAVNYSALPLDKIRHVGYPMRKEIVHSLKKDCRARLGLAVQEKLLVVLGGSQGALCLNEWAREHVATLAQHNIQVYCVAGLGKGAVGEVLHAGGRGEDLPSWFVDFEDRMGDVWSAADLVVSRAGAGSIAEMTHCGAPAILVPYPYAKDNHQAYNASFYEQQGCGWVLKQEDLPRLLDEVLSFFENAELAFHFKRNMARADRPDALREIIDDLEASLGLPSTNVLALAQGE